MASHLGAAPPGVIIRGPVVQSVPFPQRKPDDRSLQQQQQLLHMQQQLHLQQQPGYLTLGSATAGSPVLTGGATAVSAGFRSTGFIDYEAPRAVGVGAQTTTVQIQARVPTSPPFTAIAGGGSIGGNPQPFVARSASDPPNMDNEFIARKREMIARGRLYEDPDFRPRQSSLYYKKPAPASIVWKRPRELVRDPKFIKDGASRFDLNQGDLGDCWFIAAAATMAISHQKLFERVVPPDQSFDDDDYAGMFCFNFWRAGEWQQVVIDDYLPTNYGTQLIYASNSTDPSEFWPALLEKAYAKLNGCYEALDGGNIQDALVDMTGGLSEEITLSNKAALPPNLFDLILSTARMNSMMGCAIPSDRIEREAALGNGLYRGHAYSITAVVKDNIKGREVKLLRLRNPWGRREWNGRWSDGSKEWLQLTPTEREKFNLVFQDDGEFWISFDDVIANFTQLSFCHLLPDALTTEVAEDTNRSQWESAVMHGDWVRGITAGGCGNPPDQKKYWINPQFRVDVKRLGNEAKPVPVIVALLEKENRMRSDPVAIGFDVWQLLDERVPHLENGNYSQQALSLLKRTEKYTHNRELTLRLALEPGAYVIIVSTFTVHQEAKFLLRVYTETADATRTSPIDQPTRLPEIAPPAKSPVEELFNKYAGTDRVIDAHEFQSLLNDYFRAELLPNEEFTLDCARSLLSVQDKNQTGFLELPEVRIALRELNAWKDAFRKFDKDKTGSIDISELTALCQSIGFVIGRRVLVSMVRRYGGKRGTIALSDFLTCLCKLTTMYSVFQSQKKTPNQMAEISLEEWLAMTLLY